MNKIAFLFPGQGAQYVGMAKDFHDHFPIAKETFQEADDLLSSNFSRLIFEGPSDELTLTKNAQVAIFIASIAIWRTVCQQFPSLKPAVCAGLSLGEYTALTASSRLSFAECLSLVRARGNYMHEACLSTEGTLQVVLGLEPEAVEQALHALAKPHQAWIANLNCPGQVVIAGTKAGMPAAAEAIKAKGAKRVLPLEVSGAFHSPLMREAQERLSSHILSAPFKESEIALVMNVPGRYVTALAEMKRFLIDQVTSPVYWEKGIRAMMADAVTLHIEMGCGKTLQGMNKRIGVPVPTLSIEKITNLEELYAFSKG